MNLIRMIRFWLLVLGLFFSLGLKSQEFQDSLKLDKDFKFEDGVYLNYGAFKTNKPNHSWEDLKSNLFTNPISAVTYVEEIYLKDSLKINLDEVWGLSLGGFPYLNTKTKTKEGLTIFSVLKIRGAISFYEYTEHVKISKIMHAYNPMTGIPFRTAEINTETEELKEFMFSHQSGEIVPFNKENLMALIQDDGLLLKSVKEVQEDQKEKLFKSLLIYCDRNHVKVPLYK